MSLDSAHVAVTYEAAKTEVVRALSDLLDAAERAGKEPPFVAADVMAAFQQAMEAQAEGSAAA